LWSEVPAVNDQVSLEERKQVTVLFADLSGFTSLSEELDPEEISALLNTYFEAIAEVVRRYDGRINKYVGDEVMVLFGAPIAHEDDPERAVRAALEIMEAVERLELEIPGGVKWHIGINSGLVVAGEIGASHKREYEVIGDTVNTASRILDEADGGQILVGESVFKRTRDVFEYLEFGAVTMKGKREKVAVYQPTSALPRRRRLDLALQRGPSRFVGRQAELEGLMDGFERASTEGLQIAAIQAPAGSGKSRLLYEFRRRLSGEVEYLEGAALPFGEVSAYQPLLDLLRRYWNLAERVDDEVAAEVTERLTKMDMLEHRAVFEDLFSLAHSDESYSEHSPQRRKTMTISALLTFLRKVAVDRPVVVAIDDLQWADQSTVELLGVLIDQLTSEKLLLVLLARPEFEWPWRGTANFTLSSLTALHASESEELIGDLLDGPPASDLVDYILARSEGNPFFTEEIVRALDEEDALELNAENQLTASPDGLGLPETVQGIISARIDRLAPEPKQVLETAGVIGRAFDSEVLAHVLDADSDWLNEQLAVLVEAQFVDPPNGDLATHQFVHALTRDVAYSLPLKRVRRQLHADVARVLEAVKPDTVQTHPEVLAQHYTAARDVAKAVSLWQRAAERAIQRSANAEAIAHVQEALALVRGNGGEPDAKLELQLLTTIAVAHLTTKGFASPEVEAAYAEAREVGSRVDDPAMLAPALRGLWIFHNMRGDYEIADQLAAEFLSLAEDAGDKGMILEARRASGITTMARGDLEAAETHLVAGLELSEHGDHREHIHLYGQDPLVANLGQMGWLLAMRGDLAGGLEYAERSIANARGTRHPFSVAGALFMSGMVGSLCHNWEKVGTYANECIEVAGEHQFGFLLAHAHVLAAWSRAQEAETDASIEEAVAAMQTSLAAYEKSGASWILPYYEACLASQLGRLERIDEALGIVEQGLSRAETTGEQSWTSELLRVRSGLLATGSTSEKNTETDLHDAVGLARDQGAVTFQLAATLDLAKLRPGRVQDELSDLVGSLRSAPDHPLALRARELLSA
jgi:predicted ATPase/class 3 adenylate cyclase